jgi:hypothetical protein
LPWSCTQHRSQVVTPFTSKGLYSKKQLHDKHSVVNLELLMKNGLIER